MARAAPWRAQPVRHGACDRPGLPTIVCTEVTERWQDRRTHGPHLLGRIFTGTVANDRPAANRDGIRATLARLKRELEEPGRG